MARVYATIKTPEKMGEVYRHNGATAPLLVRVDSITQKIALGYWETRLEIHSWACEQLGVNCEDAIYEDAFTGEVLDYWDLVDESIELEEAI